MGEMDDIEAFARANRRKRGIRFAILGLVCAAPFLWVGYSCQKQRAKNAAYRDEERARNALSKEEQASLDKLLPEIGRSIQAASKAFAEDVTPATLGAAVPGEAGCRREIGTYGYLFVKPGEQPKPASLESAARSLADLEERIKSNEDGATKYELERAQGLAESIDETVIVVGEQTEPAVLGDSFVPGQVRGTAYVYSSRRRAIVCAGDFEAQNSSEIAFEYTTNRYDTLGTGNKHSAAQDKLRSDLAERTRKAIGAALRQTRSAAP